MSRLAFTIGSPRLTPHFWQGEFNLIKKHQPQITATAKFPKIFVLSEAGKGFRPTTLEDDS